MRNGASGKRVPPVRRHGIDLLVQTALIFGFCFAAPARAKTRAAQSAPSHLLPAAINAAEPPNSIILENFNPELTVKLQIVLDRAHFSPGEIDGRLGENTI